MMCNTTCKIQQEKQIYYERTLFMSNLKNAITCIFILDWSIKITTFFRWNFICCFFPSTHCSTQFSSIQIHLFASQFLILFTMEKMLLVSICLDLLLFVFFSNILHTFFDFPYFYFNILFNLLCLYVYVCVAFCGSIVFCQIMKFH